MVRDLGLGTALLDERQDKGAKEARQERDDLMRGERVAKVIRQA